MRHAKAEHGEGLSDKDRALTARGRRASTRVGELLADRLPERILSSPSRRTRETVELLTKAAAYFGPIDFVESLYLGEPAAYVAALRERGGKAERVMIVGHNPGLEDLVTELTGERVIMPTAALAECSFELETWSDVTRASNADLVAMSYPKDDD